MFFWGKQKEDRIGDARSNDRLQQPHRSSKFNRLPRPSRWQDGNSHSLVGSSIDYGTTSTLGEDKSMSPNDIASQNSVMHEPLRETRTRDQKLPDQGSTMRMDTNDFNIFQQHAWELMKSKEPILRSEHHKSDRSMQINFTLSVAYQVFSNKLGKINAEHQTKESKWDQEFNRLQDIIGTMAHDHQGEIQLLKKSCSTEIETQLSILKKEHIVREQQWEQEWKTLVDSHTKKVDEKNSELLSLQDFHKTVVGEKNDRIDELIKDHEKRQKQLVQERDVREAQLVQEHEVREAQLVADHDVQLRQWTSELQGLNKVLLTRDNDPFLPPMLKDADAKQESDEQIKAKFSEIVKMVDDLSRVVWKTDQKIWTNQVLRSLSANEKQRSLKKDILQDHIWTLLHQYVFCSPFRLFGKEGRMLEEQWNEQCGQDPQFDNGVFVWPKLSIENERWRYITIKECRKALMRPIPSELDPRARLKKGFKTSRDCLISDLLSMMQEMTEWKDSDAERVERLVMRLINVWLELGMHRCRFTIWLSGSKTQSEAEKAQKATKSTLKLTMVPCLRRYGNVKGINLDNSTVVGGYEGEYLTVP